MHRKERIAAALAVLCMLLGLLTACRSSAVLTQTLYQQQATEVDEQQEMLDPGDEGQEDSEFDNQKDEDADTERDVEPDRGIQDENDTGEADEAADVSLNDNRNLQNYTTQTPTTEPSASPQVSSAPSVPSAAASPAPSEQTGTTPAEGEGEPETSPSPMPSPEVSEVPDTGRQITDAGGNLVTVPTNVHKVTAVGAAAQLVEIAGQDGTLLGTNAELLSSSLAQLAFSDYSGIQSWWSDDGSGAPDDVSFAALLAAAPEVCFVTSGQYTFTDAQLTTLAEYGIAAVTLYPFSSYDNLEANMQLIGEVLTGEDYNAAEIAQNYCSWVEDIRSQTRNLASEYGGTTYTMSNSQGEYEVTGTVNTLYIAGWDDDANYEIPGAAGTLLSALVSNYGSGLAYAYSPAHKEFVSAAMTEAGLNNESTRIRNKHKDSDYLYVTPMFHQFAPSVYGSRAAYYDGGGEVPIAADLFITRMYENTAYQLGVNTGVCQFPAVVAASQEVADRLADNWFWQFHGTDVYLEDGGQAYYCGICGEYKIYVNPQGMVSWAEGSAESPLESLWLACKFAGNSVDEVWNAMVSFYSDFYGVTLDDSWRDSVFAE